jgi:hypothetical protein
MPHARHVTTARKLATVFSVALAVSTMTGCMNLATLTGQPTYVGSDPSGRSVYQAPLWEGGGYFVYENGGRAFMKDR